MKRTFGANICFMCKKACGGCSWSKSFEPVPGWTAEACQLPMASRYFTRYIETYHITACPEFEPDERVVDGDGKVQLPRWN